MDAAQDFRSHVEGLREYGPPPEPHANRFTPFALRDPSEIPPRKWLFDKRLISGHASLTVSPGGLGKSSLMIVEALAMVSGKPLLGSAPCRPLRVSLWNGEDPQDELERRIGAAVMHYGLTADDIGNRLTVDSGRTMPLCIARAIGGASVVDQGQVSAIIEALQASEADVLIVDPFVTTHQVNENDNGAINAVISAWRKIADVTGIAVDLVHHSTKLGGNRGTSEENGIAQARGASALVDGVRSARFLAGMSEDDAARVGLESPHGYFQVVMGKANLAPKPEQAVWRKMESVTLGNGSGLYPEGDFVGVVTEWTPPDAFDGVTVRDLKAVQDRIEGGDYRSSDQSADWAGVAVADVMNIDIGEGLKKAQRTGSQNAGRSRAKHLLNQWIKSGSLRVEKRKDGNRDERPFVIVGDPVTADELANCSTLNKCGKTGAAGAAQNPVSGCRTTTPPFRGVVRRGTDGDDAAPPQPIGEVEL